MALVLVKRFCFWQKGFHFGKKILVKHLCLWLLLLVKVKLKIHWVGYTAFALCDRIFNQKVDFWQKKHFDQGSKNLILLNCFLSQDC